MGVLPNIWSSEEVEPAMLIRLIVIPVLVLSVLSAEVTEQKSSAELLLEALGEDNNEVDSQLGQLFYNFVVSKEKTSVTAGEFFSTFLQSLTKESLIILLLAPVILAISSLLFASFSIPTLILRGLADWGTGYLQRIKTTREDDAVLQAVSQDVHLQEVPEENLDQNPRYIF